MLSDLSILERIANIDVLNDYTLKQVLKFLEYDINEIRVLQAFRSDCSRLTSKDVLVDGEKLFLTIPVRGGY